MGVERAMPLVCLGGRVSGNGCLSALRKVNRGTEARIECRRQTMAGAQRIIDLRFGHSGWVGNPSFLQESLVSGAARHAILVEAFQQRDDDAATGAECLAQFAGCGRVMRP